MGGVRKIDFVSEDDFSHSLIRDTQGNYFLSGSARNLGVSQFALAKVTAAGNLDFSFGNSGKVVTPLGSLFSESRCLAMDLSGKITAFGINQTLSGWDVTLVRYLASGAIDTSFGTSGITTLNLGSGTNSILACSIQSDGSLFAAGYANQSGQDDLLIVKFLSNGQLDSSFANNGVFLSDVQGSSQDRIYSLAIQPDGKILAGGYSQSTQSDFLIVRINANGTFDSSFAIGGKSLFSMGAGPSEIRNLKLLTNGEIIVTGLLTLGAETQIATARLMNNGILDNSFGMGGKSLITLNHSNDQGLSLSVLANDKIIIGGFTYVNGQSDALLLRVWP